MQYDKGYNVYISYIKGVLFIMVNSNDGNEKININITNKYIGRKYGNLTIVEYSHNVKRNKVYKCKCDCGNEKSIYLSSLKGGRTKSCGCIQESKNDVRNRLRNIWHNMINRCYKASSDSYKYYGELGVVVCLEWRHDFEAFYSWALDNGYSDKLTLDRIDVNGNYEPSNCRWATNKEQLNNRRDNVLLTHNEITKTLPQWADDLGIKQHVLRNRINRGWETERALTTPVKKYGGNKQ